MLLLALVQAGVTYRTTRGEAEDLFDAQMQRVAVSLTGSLGAGDAAASLEHGPAAQQELVIQIWRADGVMLYRSPTRQLLPLQAVLGFTTLRIDGALWRVYALQTPVQVVQVAQQIEARQQMASQLALRSVLPMLLLAPLLMLVVWWVVGRALAPVERVRQQVAARRADDLAPLLTQDLPAELRPLIDEMNALLTRLAAAWDTLTHFTADAAHELRSPLAALRLQVQSLQRAPDAATRQLASERLLAGIDRATRVVEQLLALARQEGSAAAAALGPVDLAALARAGVAEAQPEAQHAGIDLSVDAPETHLVPGQRDAMAVLLRNLLENALRHTPAGGQVRVAVRAAASGSTELLVEDSGPGIAAEERQRVLDRFYRVPGAPGHGSGLGLAIVHTVARQHGATLELRDAHSGSGLRVVLTFAAPAPTTSPTA